MKKHLIYLFALAIFSCANTEQYDEYDDQSGTAHPIVNDIDIGKYSKNNKNLSKKSQQKLDVTSIDLQLESPQKQYEDIWEKVADNLELKVPNDRRVTAQLNWYKRHQEYMNRVAKRAEPFLYFIVQEIEKRDMPLDLVLLPIVESAFDPLAYSHMHASGMWQIIPSTGKRFGLKINWWYDGRQDVVASTNAALNFLEYLHEYFDGDWLHALAAYNSGEGRVRRAISYNKRRGRKTDFWSLKLPRETRAYVPKMLALNELLANSKKYNFEFREIKNEKIIENVKLDSQIDLHIAAQLAEVSEDEIYALNTGYLRWATSSSGQHDLVLPLSKVETFQTNLKQLPKNQRLSWKRYKIKKGDTLSTIARNNRTQTKVIKDVNSLKSNKIILGDMLLIPVAANENSLAYLKRNKRYQQTLAKRQTSRITHTVKKGDTLWDISRDYQVSLNNLKRWNSLRSNSKIVPGKKLIILQKENNAQKRIVYKIRKGDSLDRIARKFNVKAKDIARWNGMKLNEIIRPGEMLRLYVRRN